MNPLVFVVTVFSLFLNNNLIECIPKRATPLKGLFVSVVTPMDDRGRVNLTNIPAYAEYLKDNDIDGILVAGVSGEGSNLNVAEKKSLFDAWTMFAKTFGLKIIAQVGAASLPDILELAKYANNLNVDAIIVLPTTYYRPISAEQLTVLMETVAKAAPSLPLLYEDFLGLSNVDMAEFFYLASERISQFKGIMTDLRTALHVVVTNELRPDQRIYIFDYALISAAVVYGFDSFIASSPGICPELVNDIIKSTEKGNCKRAGESQWRLTKLVHDALEEYDFVAALKTGTELASGIELGDPRKPILGIPKEDRKNFAKLLKKYDIPLAKKK